jgi:autotransporter-associated beta strand protein
MLRAKSSSRRRNGLYRTLRLEPLERRALLSAATTTNSPPTITLLAANEIGDFWDFDGKVTGGSGSVAGLTVNFGGVLAKYGLSATTEANGTYYITEELRGLTTGTATAQTANAAGPSNVAMDFIDNGNLPVRDTSGIPVQSPGLTGGASAAATTITTVAGLSRYLGDGNAAVDATLNSPQGVAVDSLGNIYIADTYNDVVREVNPFTGDITTVAGDGVCGYTGDGAAATDAELDAPTGVAVDSAGDIFIADTGNNVIREVIHATDTIITVAGNGNCGFSGDGGAATAAELNCPSSVAVDGAGDLFIADSGNNVVREVDLNLATPTIATVAGNYALGSGYSGDGNDATSAQLSYPMGVAASGNGFLYIADTGNNVVREVNLNLASPTIVTVAGNYTLGSGYSGDGNAATSAQLNAPTGVAVDGSGDFFIADSGNSVIREVNPTSHQINTIAGTGIWGYSGNGGPPAAADLSDPTSVAVDGAGDLFIADSINNAVREVDASAEQIKTVAGNGEGTYNGDGGPATGAELYGPMGVAADAAGDLFIADSNNNVVRKVDASTGAITTVAGIGTWGYGGDGAAATSAQLDDPMGITVDAAGNVYIADSLNNVVRKVDPAGTITTIAGNFALGAGYSGDGFAATAAQLDDPTALAVDGDCLYIADTGNNVVRSLNLSTGIITTVAGNYALGSGYSGDGQAATAAQLNGPTGIAVDAAGNLYIADSGNDVVREVNTSGTITTVAGNYALGSGYSGDGHAATAAQLNVPNSVAVDAAGNLYIADSGNNVVRRVDPSGTITTFAGSYGLGPGYSGDGGPATESQFYFPTAVAVDGSGDVFIADSVNNVIRKVTPPLYWDPHHTDTENAGGPGTWMTGGNAACWFDPYLGTDVEWSNGGNAYFAGAGGTVTISGVVSPASVTFCSDSYDVVAATSSNSLVLPAGGATVNVAADQAVIDLPITGSATLFVDGSGILLLGGDYPCTWGTDLESGTVQLSLGATMGSGSLTACGGELDMGGNSITVASLAGSGGVITNNCSSSISTLTVAQNISSTFFGGIQDGNGIVRLVMAGTGALALPSNNAFSGGVGVTAGRLALPSPDTVPDGTSLTVGVNAIAYFGMPAVNSNSDGNTASTPYDPSQTTSSTGTGATAPPGHSPPVVTSIQCVGAAVVDADSVAFGVTFSTPVNGVTASNFAVSGLAGTVSSVGGSGAQYTVTVSAISPRGNGTLGLTVVNANTITDFYGASLAESAVAVDQQYTINRNLYFDASSGTATWSPSIAVWHVGSPSGPLQAWVDDSDAFFAGAPGTVDIASPVAVAAMSFLSDGFVLEGNTITLTSSSSQAAASSTIAVATGTATIDDQIVGGAMTKTGDGTLALDTASSYSSTSVAAGLLQVQCAGALPTGSSLQVTGGDVDLGGNTAALSSVTLVSGSIVDGGVQVAGLIQVYSGMVLADMSGTAALEKLGPGTAVLAGQDSYQGGTNAAAGILVVASTDALPGGTATGAGTVLVQPTLYWSGSGDWTTGTWQLPDGTPTPWIDGSNVVLAPGSALTISGSVNVGAIATTGAVTITGGTLGIPSWGEMITVVGGTATINSAIVGGSLTKAGSGELVLGGTLGCDSTSVVVGGVLDVLSPLAAAPIIAGGQAIGPGAVFSADGTSLYTLDPAMFDLVQSLFAGGTIDRADMIQILQSSVIDGSVTPSALEALQALTLPQSEASLDMPDYVAVLARDVVDGNPANAFYQGQPLGNLADQSSDQARGTAIEDLVGKWFYGTDTPAAEYGATYCVTAGPLFGDNPDPALDVPSSADMQQGDVGDCYFIAALGALAGSCPSAIENMFIDNGVENGMQTWTVRFYYDTPQGYTADYVTVNAMLPGLVDTCPLFAKSSSNGGWWIPLLEKAYAQWNETGHEGRNGQNSYASLSGGWMDAVDEQVLGCAAADYSPSGTPGAEQAVIDALQAGGAVTAGIFTDGSAQFNALQLVSSHAYQVVSYDANPQSANYGTFQLANPWGSYEPQPLTWSELAEFCAGITVAGAPPSAPPSVPAVSASAPIGPSAAFHAALARRYAPTAASLTSFAGNTDSRSFDDAQAARIRALDMLFADYNP